VAVNLSTVVVVVAVWWSVIRFVLRRTSAALRRWHARNKAIQIAEFKARNDYQDSSAAALAGTSGHHVDRQPRTARRPVPLYVGDTISMSVNLAGPDEQPVSPFRSVQLQLPGLEPERDHSAQPEPAQRMHAGHNGHDDVHPGYLPARQS
jgi:hypothetical protein